MDISIGTRLRDFAVVSSLGAGGMGQVFRARDVNLGREVALKVLPDAFADDQSRRARFAREAKSLAALSHPGIASIYEFFEHDGRFVLIMELVEGETLDQALRRGAMPMAKGLDVALQIAEAIEHAHARGILHRDLKPANIQVSAAGKVKLLDFGLARVLDPAHADGDAATTAGELTQPRAVIGTPAYMSPEQARGERVDRRSDIFSFGSVVFELLTATRAFSGKTSSDSLVAVLDREPAWDKLPREIPSTIRDLLRRCLQKDANRRLHDISDARIVLQEPPNERAAGDTDSARRASRTRWTLAAAVTVLAILTSGFVAWNWRTPPTGAAAPSAKIMLALAADNSLNVDGGVAISPDGQTLVFAASSKAGSQLFARRLDEWQPRAMPGTEGARTPFFSPDGNSVAFVRSSVTIEKIRLSGGPAQLICKIAGARGGSWGRDGTIIFGSWPNAGLWRVSADGGSPAPLSIPSEGHAGAAFYVWPHQLPDSNVVLFTIVRSGQTSIAALQANGEARTLVESGSHPQYLESGHLVYLANGNLTAVAFDVERLQTRGGATVLVEDVRQDQLTVSYGVSSTGALAYVPRGSTVDRLVWKDRQGSAVPLDIHQRRYDDPNLSSDGKRFSATVYEGSSRNVWIGSVDREPLARLTFGDDDVFGLWTRDNSRLALTAGQGGRYNIFWTRTDGSGKPERLTDSAHAQKPTSWSPVSDVLLFNDIDSSTGLDIWKFSLASREARPLIKTRYREMEAVFSPDGTWIAYQSDESGRFEVWAQAYPEGPKIQISTDGGSGPMWRGDGGELFYQTATEMMAVPVLDPRNLRVGRPTRLFEHAKGPKPGRDYDVTQDGKRFLLIDKAAGIPSRLHLVLNWSDEVRRAVASVQP